MLEDIIDNDDNSMLAHTPEGKLMTCILMKAVEDALYRQRPNFDLSKNTKYDHQINADSRIDAIKWLFTNSDLLDLCCFIVNIHKDSIRKKIVDILTPEVVHPIVYKTYKP